MLPIYYSYSIYTYNNRINKVLLNNSELLEYRDLFLSDYFSLTSATQLTINFLNNPYLFNFFKNLLILYPATESIFLDFTFQEKKEIINFFESVKSNSFNEFKINPIKRETFYKLLYYINKSIFILDI